MKMTRKRVDYLDAIAGLLILVMIAGHCGLIGFGKFSIGQLFSFYMGWFFFKSGMFHSTRKLNAALLEKFSTRLLRPFVIFSSFGLLFALIRDASDNPIDVIEKFIVDILTLGASTYNIPLWFLSSLFVVKLITSKLTMKRWLIWLIVSVIVAFTHNFFFKWEQFPFIGNIALATACYTLGYRLSKSSLNLKIATLCAVGYVSLHILSPSCINFFRNHNVFGNYYIAVLGILPGIIAINTLFKNVSYLNLPTFKHFGSNSMKYLVVHYPICLFFSGLGGGVLLCCYHSDLLCNCVVYFS